MRHALNLLRSEAARLRSNARQHRQYRGGGDGTDLVPPETEARDYDRRAAQCEQAAQIIARDMAARKVARKSREATP